MSRCFGTKELMDELKRERMRQRDESYTVEFENTSQYVNFKLKMLRNEMFIEPTPEEVTHLYELKTRGDIDRAVCSVIDRHWS